MKGKLGPGAPNVSGDRIAGRGGAGGGFCPSGRQPFWLQAAITAAGGGGDAGEVSVLEGVGHEPRANSLSPPTRKRNVFNI